jgi:hypothetical protein
MPIDERDDEGGEEAEALPVEDEPGDGDAVTTPRARPAPPIGKGGPGWPNKIVRERRVTEIFALYVAGLQRWDILAAVAAAQAKEQAERATARDVAIAAGSAEPDVEALRAVPLLWGDAPIPTRTLDDYLKRARALLDGQSKEFAKQRARRLAVQVARIDATYAAATVGGKHYAALKAVELLSELLDLKGFAKQSALDASLAATRRDGGAAATAEDEESDPRQLPTDPASRADAFADLVRQSIAADPGLRAELSTFAPRTTVMP